MFVGKAFRNVFGALGGALGKGLGAAGRALAGAGRAIGGSRRGFASLDSPHLDALVTAFNRLPRGTGLDRHHLFPKSWLKFLRGPRINPNDIPSVLLDPKFHREIHNMLNAKIGQRNWLNFPFRSDNTSLRQKLDALEKVYASIGHPEWYDEVVRFFIGKGML